MKKVVISVAGRVGIINGPNAANQRLTWTTPEGFDPTDEEFEINPDPKQFERLKRLKSAKEYRKFRIRKLYKRGENPKIDAKRDAVDLQEL